MGIRSKKRMTKERLSQFKLGIDLSFKLLPDMKLEADVRKAIGKMLNDLFELYEAFTVERRIADQLLIAANEWEDRARSLGWEDGDERTPSNTH